VREWVGRIHCFLPNIGISSAPKDMTGENPFNLRNIGLASRCR